MNKKAKFALRLSEKQLKTLRAIAKTEKRTVSAVIRNLIDEIGEKRANGKGKDL